MKQKKIYFDISTSTKIGSRSKNQDFLGYKILEKYACFVIADGLGSHKDSDIAANLAVKTILNSFQKSPGFSKDKLNMYIKDVKSIINKTCENNENLELIGSTIVVMLTNKRSVIIGHIGDSRLYHFRDNKIIYQTKDDSIPQLFVDMGELTIEEIKTHPDRNRLTKSLGFKKEDKLTISNIFDLYKNDKFLLCTDGFWSNLTDFQIGFELKKNLATKKCKNKFNKIIENNLKNDSDNYSMLLVFARFLKKSKKNLY